ncbi:MAG TPA: zf-HC2 domain-containing protein [Terracidiphilus sp.]|nr:zf-HC2 domain-containing protein [Terracidiphilus sp.]
MAERMHIPTSPACGQWETLLADALDGLLKPEDEATFTAHMAACPACAALFEEARRGREWLDFLDAEPEVPEGLLEKLLAHTGPGKENEIEWVSGGAAVIPAAIPAWQRPGFMGFVRRFAEPRLLMTAAMAFFSITVTLNMTGIKVTSLRLSDLRPAAIRSFMERQFTVASVPIIRYYDHLRFVYEVESKMRQLRGNVIESQGNNGEQNQQPSQQPVTPGESKQVPGHKDGGSRLDVPQQDPPQQSVRRTLPDSGEMIETRFELNTPSRTSNIKFGVETNTFSGIQKARAHLGGSTNAVDERSTRWIVQTIAA